MGQQSWLNVMINIMRLTIQYKGLAPQTGLTAAQWIEQCQVELQETGMHQSTEAGSNAGGNLRVMICCQYFSKSCAFGIRLAILMSALFPNGISFGAFSHSKGFGAALLSDYLWFSGADPSGAAKRLPRSHQNSSSLVVSLVFWGRSVLGCQKFPWKVCPPRFREGLTKVPPRLYRGSTKVAQVSWSLWSCGAYPFWEQGSTEALRFQQGFTNLSPTALALGSLA